MNAKQLIDERLKELQNMRAGKMLEHDKLQEIKSNQDAMKLDNRRTRTQIRKINSELASLDNMILVNELVFATC